MSKLENFRCVPAEYNHVECSPFARVPFTFPSLPKALLLYSSCDASNNVPVRVRRVVAGRGGRERDQAESSVAARQLLRITIPTDPT